MRHKVNMPRHKDTRIMESFLFIPKKLLLKRAWNEIVEEWRWLETARWKEIYFVSRWDSGWKQAHWIDE